MSNLKFKEDLESERVVEARRAVEHLVSEIVRADQEREDAELRASRFREAALALLPILPRAEQDSFRRQLDSTKASNALDNRSSEVFGQVIDLFRRMPRAELSVPDVNEELKRSGITADLKAIYNVVAYLAKTGRLKRVSRGQYTINGMGAGIEYDGPDDGTKWATEHEV